MKKTVLVCAVTVCGCLVPVDPSQSPLGAGSRFLGTNLNGAWALRESYDATYASVSPELGFLFTDNFALILTPFYSLEIEEAAANWQRGGFLIGADYTFYQPGRSVHPFLLGEFGFSAVTFDDGVNPVEESQGFALGAGGGIRLFHSSYCSLDTAARWRYTTLNFPTLSMTGQHEIWGGLAVKLYFPVRTSLQTR